MNNQNTSNRKFIFWLTTIIAIVLLIFSVNYFNQKRKLTAGLSPLVENNEFLIESSEQKEEHVRGDIDAPITIVEFSDFQCSFCSGFHPTIMQVMQNYQGRVKWVYKHFPLDSIHLQARPAAEASECADEQNKFWEFVDGLFENQSKLGETFYRGLASELGLDMSQFEDCVSSRKYKDKVEQDLQQGIASGVRGTPGNFINGQSVSGGAVPYETLKSLIDQALSEI